MAATHAKSSVRRTDEPGHECLRRRMWRGYYNISHARGLMDVFAIVNPLSGAGANPGSPPSASRC